MKEKIYTYLTRIPAGKVVTYGQIASYLGNKNLARAVGNMLHKNPNPKKYPCYKVVNSKGELSSQFAFGGLQGQKRLLQKDGVEVFGNRVDLKRYGYQNAPDD